MRRSGIILGIGALLATAPAWWWLRADEPTGAQEAQTVLKYQASYFQKLSSLYVEATTTSEPCETSADAEASRMQILTSGERYRAVHDFFDETTKRRSIITTAFDGTSYQMMHDRRILEIYEARNAFPYGAGALHPFTTLFMFAYTTPDDFSFARLQRDTTWNSLVPTVKHCERSSIGDRQAFRIQLRPPGLLGLGTNEFDLFFASDLDYLPLQWSLTTAAGTKAECAVTKVKSFDTALGAIQVPIRIETTESADTLDLDQSTCVQIDAKTVRINAPVDGREFVIPKSLADRCYDTDTRQMTRPLGRDPRFARQLLDAFYATSFADLEELVPSMALGDKEQETIQHVSEEVRKRCGAADTMRLHANSATERFQVETVWDVVGETSNLQMKVIFDWNDKPLCFAVRYRPLPEEAWTDWLPAAADPEGRD